MHQVWTPPKGGEHHVAIKARLADNREAEVEGFFGRPLARHSHDYTLVGDGTTYRVYSFADPAEAEAFMRAFDGQPFDIRDRGGGSKWMYWFKGRSGQRKLNRSPYDFSERD